MAGKGVTRRQILQAGPVLAAGRRTTAAAVVVRLDQSAATTTPHRPKAETKQGGGR